MTCPQCNKQNDSCFPYWLKQRKMYRRRPAKIVRNTDGIKCAYCRNISHIDAWSDEWGQPELNEKN